VTEFKGVHKGPYFIGWDVGGWNCSKNKSSRDAIVILDSNGHIEGIPWRGNLSSIIHESPDQHAFIQAMFTLCKTECLHGKVTLAIDTPLGFSDGFRTLLEGKYLDGETPNALNPYLFRKTEQFLAGWGYTPLSSIKDMIGSQATKGMHVVAKFAANILQTGVWQYENLTIIEAYPSPCACSELIFNMQQQALLSWIIDELGNEQLLDTRLPTQDHIDALTCALIAKLFALKPQCLTVPDNNTSQSEGWIFVPKDCLKDVDKRTKFLLS
jgi:hypothetical protein